MQGKRALRIHCTLLHVKQWVDQKKTKNIVGAQWKKNNLIYSLRRHNLSMSVWPAPSLGDDAEFNLKSISLKQEQG